MTFALTMRRSTALTLGALLLGAPVLSSCGSMHATDRSYTPGSGVNDQTKSVDVLNAAIVGQTDGSGTFIASFANNNNEQATKVTNIALATANAPVGGTSVSITVPPGGLVNLAQNNQGVPMTGDFKLGDFVPVQVSFSTGEQLTLDVPVVLAANQYAGLDSGSSSSSPSASTPSSSASPLSSTSPSASPS